MKQNFINISRIFYMEFTLTMLEHQGFRLNIPKRLHTGLSLKIIWLTKAANYCINTLGYCFSVVFAMIRSMVRLIKSVP